MGLDMYMEKGKKIPKISWEEYSKINEEINDNNELKEKYKEYIVTNGDEKYYSWQSLYKEVGYWRKANAIHKWFVANVQNGVDDCNKYLLTRKNLEDLFNICDKVLKSMELVDGKVIKDTSTAEELLPTQSGFFFGDTEYDEWYYNKIEYTYDLLKDLLENFDFENNYLIYQSSW